MTAATAFTPSANITLQAGPIPAQVTLPAVDTSNTAVAMKNNGPGVVALVPVAVAGQLFGRVGVITLQAGETRLLAAGSGFEGAAVAMVQSIAASNPTIVFMRGTINPLMTFNSVGAVA